MATRRACDIKDKTVYGLVQLLQAKERELQNIRTKYEELYNNTPEENRRTLKGRDKITQTNIPSVKDVSIQADTSIETCSDDMDFFSTQCAESNCHMVDSNQTNEYLNFPKTDLSNIALSVANETKTTKEIMHTASSDRNKNLDSFKGYTDMCSYQNDIDLEHIYVTIEDTTLQCPRISESNDETLKQLPKRPSHSKHFVDNLMRIHSSRNLSHTCKHSSKKIPREETSHKCFMRYQISRSVIKRKRRSPKTDRSRCNSDTTVSDTVLVSQTKHSSSENPTVIPQLHNDLPNSCSTNRNVLILDLEGSKFNETVLDDSGNGCAFSSNINDIDMNSHTLNKVVPSDCQERVSACHKDLVCHGNDSIEQEVYHGNDDIEQEVCQGNDAVKQEVNHGNDSIEQGVSHGTDAVKQEVYHGNDSIEQGVCHGNDSTEHNSDSYYIDHGDIFPSIQFTDIDVVSENNDSDLRTCSQFAEESDDYEPISHQENSVSYRECDTDNCNTADGKERAKQRRLDKVKLYLHNGLDDNINESFV